MKPTDWVLEASACGEPDWRSNVLSEVHTSRGREGDRSEA